MAFSHFASFHGNFIPFPPLLRSVRPSLPLNSPKSYDMMARGDKKQRPDLHLSAEPGKFPQPSPHAPRKNAPPGGRGIPGKTEVGPVSDQFSRSRMLLGDGPQERLFHASVALFGVGGVGASALRPWPGPASAPWICTTTTPSPRAT